MYGIFRVFVFCFRRGDRVFVLGVLLVSGLWVVGIVVFWFFCRWNFFSCFNVFGIDVGVGGRCFVGFLGGRAMY